MKILTNIQFAKVAGIAQTLSSFVKFVDGRKKSEVQIVGVDVNASNSKSDQYKVTEGNFSLRQIALPMPSMSDIIKTSDSIHEFKESYEVVIEAYAQAIREEKPDMVLLNGTYYLPWCLFMAAERLNIPTVLHYHGILSKETEHWDEKPRKLFQDLERCFDSKKLFYIFPSDLTKQIVENEVFGHKVKKSSVLPNPIPLHFFDSKGKKNKKTLGMVGRWTRIKNPLFFKSLAKYNQKKGSKFNINIVSDIKRGSKDWQDLSGLVNFKRPVDNSKLTKLYQDMSVVLCPSYFETYGNVAQEAIATGVPALVSSNMGVAETFRKVGLHDWVVDFDSMKDIYKKIEQVSKEDVPESSRNMMKEMYSPDVLHGE
ncbi:MAG TPA: glycosyltransferase family 4 protein, partial [Flavobacterium sp.]|nr:glycosyltransferase family 4 protein [Flavobacterium sp.]